MRQQRRIIPISSGKGGVGKTTFALNYALSLSRHARTVLIDLDMGTSSVRNLVDIKVHRDLYHFFKKGSRLEDCVTTLDRRLDPASQFGQFGLIAAPIDLIDDITNFDRTRRDHLIDGINTLDATYIVLDLKSGVDVAVIDFLPFSNSGILVFTPFLTAATLAASQVVKAMLFRKLRALFAPGSEVLGTDPVLTAAEVNRLIDRAEDVYDPKHVNLDGFLAALREMAGDHPTVRLVENALRFFRVHFVLNMFNNVQESFDTAVRPFTENLMRKVSSRLSVMNLGWVVAHPDINRANIRRVPVLLQRERAPEATAEALARLARRHLGSRAHAGKASESPTLDHTLAVQLETLRRMGDDLSGSDYRANFKYITYRSLHLMSSLRVSDFGDSRLFKESEMQHAIARRQR